MLLGPVRRRRARPRSPASPTPSTCSTGRASRSATCPPCATSPRPAAGSPRSGSASTPSWAAATAGTSSSCTARPRPPPGWPTCRRSWPPTSRRDRRADPRRLVPARAGRRVRRARHRRARLLRAERDAGLRRVGRPTWRRGADRRRAAHRRPGPVHATASTRSSAGATGYAKLFGLRIDLDRVEERLPRRMPPESRALRRGRRRPARSSRPDGRGCRPVHAAGDRLCGLPARAVRVHVLAGAAGHRERQAATARRSSGTPGWSASADARDPGRTCPPPPSRSATTTRWCSAGRTPPWTAASSASAATRCPTSSWRPGSATGSASCPPDWHTRPIARARGPGDAGRAGACRSTPGAAARRSRSCWSWAPTPTCSPCVGGAHSCSPWPASTSPASSCRGRAAGHARAPRTRRGRPGRRAQHALHRRGRPRSPAITRRPPPCSSTALLGSDSWTASWQFWFLEALVWISLGAVALLAVPAVDRLERRAPFRFAVAAAARRARVALRLDRRRGRARPSATRRRSCCGSSLLGWVAARPRTRRRQSRSSRLAAVAAAGFFGDQPASW